MYYICVNINLEELFQWGITSKYAVVTNIAISFRKYQLVPPLAVCESTFLSYLYARFLSVYPL